MEPNKATIDFIKQHLSDSPKELAFIASKYPEVDFQFAITQLAGRQSVKDKLPLWYQTEDIRYPKHLSIEQCSSEITAIYKSTLVKGETLVDLTGGLGVDCTFLASRFDKVMYVERQQELCELAIHNFPLLGLDKISILHEDTVEFLSQMDEVDCIFIDPARRNKQGGKTVAISDCEPNVKELAPLLLEKAATVIIKLSPMLDLTLSLKELPHVAEAHVISVGNECKELVLLMNRNNNSLPQIHCVNFHRSGKQEEFVFDRLAESTAHCSYTAEIGKYIYEPNSSILKAGAYKSIASFYGLKKLHPNSHLYTSDQLIADFPGRVFIYESYFTLNKKEFKAAMGNIGKANITVRNFPVTVAELRKRTKLKEGGDVYLFATTLSNDKKVLIRCKKA